MCGASFPEAINARFSQPKLGPAAPPVVLVATRPCSAGQTTTRAAPRESDNTTLSVWRCRKSRSSTKRMAEPTADPLYHASRKISMSRNSGAVLLSGPNATMPTQLRVCRSAGARPLWRRRVQETGDRRHRRHPQGDDARVLEVGARRRREGGAGAGGEDHLEGPAARGRPRGSDRGRRELHQHARDGHRAGAARRHARSCRW